MRLGVFAAVLATAVIFHSIGASGATGVPEAVTHAAPAGGTVFQLNLYGNFGSPSPNLNPNTGPAAIMSINSRNPKPSVLMFSEVCTGNSAQMDPYLYNWGYTQISYQAHRVGGSCGYFGNTVWYRGSIAFAGYVQEKLPPFNAPEPRTIVCIQGVSPFGNFWHCNTHITPNPADQGTQMDHVMYIANSKPALTVGGDFNMIAPTPSQPNGLYLYALQNLGYFESQATGAIPATPPTFRAWPAGTPRRIDYVFFNNYFVNPHHNRIYGPLDYTDHYIYEAWYA